MMAPFALRRPRRPHSATRPVGPILVVLVTALVGFLAVSQLRSTQRFSQRLQAENEEDLTRILASLTTQTDALRDETTSLRLQLVSLQASSKNDAQAGQAAREQLQSLQVLAGTVPVTGPGIALDVNDPGRNVGYDALIDVIEELRDAGAEAIAVNGRRVGPSSSLSQQGGDVRLDDAVLAAPYRVAAIGQSDTLEGGLEIPGGAIDSLKALKGVSAEVHRLTRVDLPALEHARPLSAARPVGSSR